jgi:hypothetical protein
MLLTKKAYSESETLRLPHIPLNLFQCGELRFPIKKKVKILSQLSLILLIYCKETYLMRHLIESCYYVRSLSMKFMSFFSMLRKAQIT